MMRSWEASAVGALRVAPPTPDARSRRRAPAALRALLALCCLFGAQCTPIGKQHPSALTVTADADQEVREAGLDFEIVLESRVPESNSWRLVESRRFPSPDPATAWPLTFRIEAQDARATYQATATARDAASAIAIQVRTISEPQSRMTPELRLQLDRDCLHRPMLCSSSRTCAAGACVDARQPVSARVTDASQNGTTSPTSSQMPEALEGSACATAGAHACAADSGTQPLLCSQGSWQRDAPCPDGTRCDTWAASTLGTCQPQAPQCETLKPGDRFCDSRELMQECHDNQVAGPLPCGDNERCVEVDRDVHCACAPGYVRRPQGCVEGSDCLDGGGCDPLTKCLLQNGKRSCTSCPPGYAPGTGEQGCAPLLSALQVSPGQLEPIFDPLRGQYTVRVPVLTSRLSITARAEVSAELSIDGERATLGVPWSSPALDASKTQLLITLRASSGALMSYKLMLTRDDAEQVYLKAGNPLGGAWFGSSLAAYGNTVVVSAPREPGDVSGTRVANAGAAYVFVRESGRWRLQARLPPSNPTENGYFSSTLSIWEDRIAIGEPNNAGYSIASTPAPGRVDVFARSGDTWTLQQSVSIGDRAGFGIPVVLRKDMLLVGAPLDGSDASGGGAFYVFRWDGSSWKQQQRMRPGSPQRGGQFGQALALDDDTIIAGAWEESFDDNRWAGAVYHYKQNSAGVWTEQQRLTAPVVRPIAHFGSALSLFGDTLIVGTAHNPWEGASNHSGEAHVFKRSGGEFRHAQVLEAPQPAVGDRFGSFVSQTESALLVGAPDASNPFLFVTDEPHTPGAAYLYTRTEKGFQRAANIKSLNGEVGDSFGSTGALTDDYFAIGAFLEDGKSAADGSDNSLRDSGAIYMLE